ncbi:fam-a protein [Plasmodium vinckei vinckei]|uniref:Fam-a protein n=1 Tax=Plasmodium vinckei vinckei TaxID=54757 RepID=A0A449BM63_PLAVN|nr:fam-a protein [Plasmodium vinckei vinckei]VEV54531.1 fam-a protein [Plasmodium vinckei vinckei]
MNKFYIKIVLFFLSVSLYVNNKVLAAEPAREIDTPSEEIDRCLTPEEIFVIHQHLLCTNPEETKQARKLMDEAVKHLEHHATSTDGYEYYPTKLHYRMMSYKKKLENKTNIIKVNFRVHKLDEYYDIIYTMWDPNGDHIFNFGVNKIARVYDPSLVIIQRRYDKKFLSRRKYFYALVKRARISENKTIIVMTSANINDHNISGKTYKNTIIENANLFTTDIDSEDDIKKGKLTKTFVNIAGCIIENNGRYINVTYIESINGYSSI